MCPSRADLMPPGRGKLGFGTGHTRTARNERVEPGYSTVVTSAQPETAAVASRGDAALRLAAELSDRARREAETARRIASVLAAQPAAELAAPAARPSDDRLVIGCRSCEVTLSPPLADPDRGLQVARSFFDRHGDCLTFVDLEPIRRLL